MNKASADTLPKDEIIRITMKAFEYAPEFQFLEDAVAHECETAPEPIGKETAVISGDAIGHSEQQIREGEQRQQIDPSAVKRAQGDG